MTKWRHVACWITKATIARTHASARAFTHARTRTPTHKEICNRYCFPQQQWLRERASVLRYKCIACLVLPIIIEKKNYHVIYL